MRKNKYDEAILHGIIMHCKLGHEPEHFGFCSRWEGSKGMTAMPMVENICEYCIHWVDDDIEEGLEGMPKYR